MFITLARSPVISQMPSMPEPASATRNGTPARRTQHEDQHVEARWSCRIVRRPRPDQVADGASCGQQYGIGPVRTRVRSTSMMMVSARKPISTKL